MRDFRSYAKKYADIEKRRLMRLREAKNVNYIKGMVENLAEFDLKPKVLSDKQRMAIHLMTDFVHNFSNVYIATKLRIDASELSKWRNDPYFLKELDKEITRRRSFIRLYAFRNVNRAIMRGDMKATWNYLKMSGDLKENVELIDKTGERELSDVELKKEIARALQEEMNGQSSSIN